MNAYDPEEATDASTDTFGVELLPVRTPEAMRIRTYAATIAQGRGSLVVTVHSQYPGWDNGRFTGEFGDW